MRGRAVGREEAQGTNITAWGEEQLRRERGRKRKRTITGMGRRATVRREQVGEKSGGGGERVGGTMRGGDREKSHGGLLRRRGGNGRQRSRRAHRQGVVMEHVLSPLLSSSYRCLPPSMPPSKMLATPAAGYDGSRRPPLPISTLATRGPPSLRPSPCFPFALPSCS